MNVTCTGAHCIVDKSTKIVLHQQNITNITFTFNNEWNDLEKEVYFINGSISKTIPLVSNNCNLPIEVSNEIGHIYIGVVGIIPDNDGIFPSNIVVLTTNMDYLAKVVRPPLTAEEIYKKYKYQISKEDDI